MRAGPVVVASRALLYPASGGRPRRLDYRSLAHLDVYANGVVVATDALSRGGEALFLAVEQEPVAFAEILRRARQPFAPKAARSSF